MGFPANQAPSTQAIRDESQTMVDLADKSIAALMCTMSRVPVWPDRALIERRLNERLREREAYAAMVQGVLAPRAEWDLKAKASAMSEELAAFHCGANALVSHIRQQARRR